MKMSVNGMVFELSARGPVVGGDGVHEDFAFDLTWWAPSSEVF